MPRSTRCVYFRSLSLLTDSRIVHQSDTLQTDKIGIRDAAKMPPLLQHLSERQPEKLDYLGVSYGITPLLFKFWKRAGYVPLYMRQTTNELTGEHTCVMLRGLNKNKDESAAWLAAFSVGESVSSYLCVGSADEWRAQTSGNVSSPCSLSSSASSRP